jgi:hypothetical protein
MKSHTVKNSNVLDRVRPLIDQHAAEIQPYGTIINLRLPAEKTPAAWRISINFWPIP